MLTDRCLSVYPVMSVTFVHCGQMVGRMEMKLGIQVGLGPVHIVLSGDAAPPPPKGHSLRPIFGPYLLRPNGCMDQDATWYGARPQPRRLYVRWRPRSTLPQKGGRVNFRPISIVTKRCMLHDATWYEGRSLPRGLCVRW